MSDDDNDRSPPQTATLGHYPAIMAFSVCVLSSDHQHAVVHHQHLP